LCKEKKQDNTAGVGDAMAVGRLQLAGKQGLNAECEMLNAECLMHEELIFEHFG